MLLAIDCGNTNTTFAVFAGDQRRAEWRSGTQADRTTDDYAVWLTHLMALEGLDRSDIDAAIIATVVPATHNALTGLSQRYFDCEPLVVGEPGLDLGVEVRLDSPQEAGADRLLNAVAAHQRYGGPAIVVDFGTATNFDVVDRDGGYLGGAIAPGVGLSEEALHQAAARLPRVAVRRPATVIGRSTVAAMQSGVFWGYIGLVEGLVDRLQAEYGAAMTVIATGGLAPLFARATDRIHHLDPDLTMWGLLEIYRRHGRRAGAAAL